MQSNNPVFRRAEGFGQPSNNAYGNMTYAGNGAPHAGYGQDPSQWSTGAPQAPGAGAPMTIDSVVQKGAITLGVVVLTAIATWVLTPDIGSATANIAPLYMAATLGAGAAFILSLVNSFKRVISPALVLAFAVAEGVALGALSKVFDAMIGGGIVVQAVIGTFAAFAGTLAAYKFFNIKVGAKFRTFVIAAMFGMVGLSLLEVVLGMFGASFGLFGLGTLGLITAVIGLALGVFMLILDFDQIEQGIRAQLPERESWRAVFGLTVSLVWIYTNLLRLLAIFQQD
ncbi:putative YccA/Bax inhibitor family protein [Nocardioides albertanoniae]|uniref:Putative YccA/Bax inhibitor family protein n=1 Tax=Nocardioides albertanoniae TaxID=1175486 RepID=A0A543ABF8_9ACTN|nr:Bax inhibitor-1/YccA family protein [Nocardioides albertanoniae]TQL69925.1 putative YccA/Bax inhibitor family protein [Nocardioides albertanoniae]